MEEPTAFRILSDPLDCICSSNIKCLLCAQHRAKIRRGGNQEENEDEEDTVAAVQELSLTKKPDPKQIVTTNVLNVLKQVCTECQGDCKEGQSTHSFLRTSVLLKVGW